MGHERNSRLPLASPAVSACALAIFVALPFTVLAAQAWGGSRRTGTAAYEAGLLLVVWVLIEVAFIREVSVLQTLFVVIGSMFCLAGRSSEHSISTERGITREWLRPEFVPPPSPSSSTAGGQMMPSSEM
jgi:hypothetical protein